jgi:hypothetical protein
VIAVRTLPFAGWVEFKRDLLLELFEGGAFRRERYLFRGAGDADWRLETSFDRMFAPVPQAERMAIWDSLVRQWRAGCEEAGVPLGITADDAKLWALGQHHGLPTRMLDWSTSPYVAAFFAFRQHLVGAEHEHRQVAVWVLHAGEPVWQRPGVQIVGPGALENVRLRNQGGRFTLCRAAFGCLEDYVERYADAVALTRCVLPASEARVALGDLDAMGITNYDLFPDLTGLAQLATMRACLDAFG